VAENRRKFQIAYTGDVADDHAMNVEALGPALVSFGKLLRAANAELNRDRAEIRVLVQGDFEDKCFNINFEVIQVVVDKVKDLLHDKEAVENATEILKKIGVIGGTTATTLGTVLGYLKWKKGQTVEVVKQTASTMVVKFKGNNNTINLSADVFQLAQSKPVLEAINGTLAPIKDHKEATGIEFRENDKATSVLKYQDVEDIVAAIDTTNEPILLPQEVEEKPKTVTATLYAHGPVFDPKAPNWRFLLRRKPIYADIKETNIAKDAVKRGGSFMNDRYKVRMEVSAPPKDGGEERYKITEVLEFTPAEQQMAMPLKKPRRKRTKKAGKN
jgi:hypothetical protein